MVLPIFFSRGHGVTSLAIRAGIGSPWARCGIFLPGGWVVEAVAPRVRMARAADVLAEIRRANPGRALAEVVAVGWVEMPRPDLAREFSLDQLGCDYDFWGALGVGFRRNWQDPSNWFCSELVAAACAAGGKPLFQADAGRVSPWDLWACGQVVRAPAVIKEADFDGDAVVARWIECACGAGGGGPVALGHG